MSLCVIFYSFADDEFFALIFDLFFAGSDTVKNTLCFDILYMLKYPDIQKKVQNEIDIIIGERQVCLQDRVK